ncbi:MAG: hypothetical protein D6716_10820 [Chloroflexi bacterium]|nr:MAG: hypothetical protein D6716_10820 [Chloroflexota bacterium]
MGLGSGARARLRSIRWAKALPDAVAAPLGIGVNLPAVRPAPMHYPYLKYCIARVPERVGGVITGVLPSRELGARASGALLTGTSLR